ncbi:MAG: DUF559 domain-containing protein [Nitrososphaeraceae archaeon]|nr:DUF559 domain-containing protein [Nitrososphaeraceae archaeon]
MMEKVLQKNEIRYISQHRYGIGIMDFYLPEGNIALFVDGAVWHADPRLYEPDDPLFFKIGASGKGRNIVTAADVWNKDRIHNNYLESQGYTVVHFWEKEINTEINRCIQIIKDQIKAYKRHNLELGLGV